MTQTSFSEEQLERLMSVPPRSAYIVTPEGNESYLPLSYFQATADHIFGVGGYSVSHSAESIRFIEVRHPVTSNITGQICVVETTITIPGASSSQEVGQAVIQFDHYNEGGEGIGQCSITAYTQAIRAAADDGFKQALALFGPVFVPQMQQIVENHENHSTTTTPPLPDTEPTDPWEKPFGTNPTSTTGPTKLQEVELAKLTQSLGLTMDNVNVSCEKRYGHGIKEANQVEIEEMLERLRSIKASRPQSLPVAA